MTNGITGQEKTFQLELFGQRLDSRMKAAGLNQADLAEAAGCSQSVISKYVSENRIPQAPILFKLAARLGVTMEWLLVGGSQQMQTQSLAESAPVYGQPRPSRQEFLDFRLRVEALLDDMEKKFG